MTYDNNNSDESFIAKRVKPRYINIKEDIFEALDSDCFKIYIALRFESDYSTDCSSVKKNIKFIINKSKISRRQVFYCLDVLEKNGLLKRQSKPGYQSIYWVADELGYFLHKSPPLEKLLPDEFSNTDHAPVHPMHGVVHQMHGVVHPMHTITNNLSTNTSKDLKNYCSSNPDERNNFEIFSSSENSKNSVYTGFDEQDENYDKSDYFENDSKIEKCGAQVIEVNREAEKSGYSYNQLNKETVSNGQVQLDNNTRPKVNIPQVPKNKSPESEKYLESFVKFYAIYPRRKGKQAAIRWFKKNKPSEEFLAMLIEDVTKRINTVGEWKGTKEQFIPYPASYLNGKRWEDAIESSPDKPKYPTKEERSAEELKIRERELKAQEEKRREIESAKNIIGKLRTTMSFSEAKKREDEKIRLSGLTPSEYHRQQHNLIHGRC